MERLFVDANVLFSAALLPTSRPGELWDLKDVELVTSLVALEEARRNLGTYDSRSMVRLDELTARMTIVPGARTEGLPEEVELAGKDIHILLAAIDSDCAYLITGDKRHFSRLFGRTIGGVMIQKPSRYLDEHSS